MVKMLFYVREVDPAAIEMALEQKDHEVGICLSQDGVYLGCRGRKEAEQVIDAIKRGVLIYAIRKDVELRGVMKLLHPGVEVIDYDKLIDIVFDTYERVINF